MIEQATFKLETRHYGWMFDAAIRSFDLVFPFSTRLRPTASRPAMLSIVALARRTAPRAPSLLFPGRRRRWRKIAAILDRLPLGELVTAKAIEIL